MDHAQPPQQHQQHQEPKIELAKALFTQSDWDSRICQETWFGGHAPYSRMFAFVILSSWCWTFSTLYSLYVFQNSDLQSVPIIQALTREQLGVIKQSHQDCFQSLCDEIGRPTAIDCIVNDDGVSNRVEYGDDVPDYIYFPEPCHDATEATFGGRYLEGVPEKKLGAIAFIALQKEKLGNTTSTSKVTSVLTLLPDCSVMVSDPEVSPEELQTIKEKLNLHGGDFDKLYQEFNSNNQQGGRHELDINLSIDLLKLMHPSRQLPPGHRESHVLKNIFCVDEMPDDVQEQALPQLATIYNFLMEYRQEILILLLYGSNIFFSFMTVGWLMVRLVIPSMVMKRVLTWPDNIGTMDIWRTLLLLCITTSFRLTSPVLAGLLAMGALWYKNSTAALEWCFLGLVAWAAPDTIYPFLDSLLGDHLDKLDAVNVLYFILHVFVIGEGYWKLITIYVVYRAYQALRESLKPPPIEQTQLRLDGNDMNMTHNGEEHAKTD